MIALRIRCSHFLRLAPIFRRSPEERLAHELRRSQWRWLAPLTMLLLAGCGKEPIPSLPPTVDACTAMVPVRINLKAGAVMISEGDRGELEKNASNNRTLAERCKLGDRSNSLGPR